MGCSVTALQRYSGFLNGVFLCNKIFINIYIYIYINKVIFFDTFICRDFYCNAVTLGWVLSVSRFSVSVNSGRLFLGKINFIYYLYI